MIRALLLIIALMFSSPVTSQTLSGGAPGPGPSVRSTNPSLGGTPTVLQTLTVTASSVSNVAPTRFYQLIRDGVLVPGLFRTIGGSALQYVIVGDDLAATTLAFRESVTALSTGFVLTADTGTVGPVVDATPNSSGPGAVAAASGNLYIDAILSGSKWTTTTGQPTVLSFSFPQSAADYGGAGYIQPTYTAGFIAFNSTQRDQGRKMLRLWERGTGLQFVEFTGGAAASAQIRFAYTSALNGGGAPNTTFLAASSDCWFPSTANGYATFTPGLLTWMNFTHEAGHALGLAHANTGGYNVMPTDRDAMEYTIMSYCSFIGQSLPTCTTTSTTSGSFPQTPMQMDYQAILYMYPASAAVQQRWQASDTTYSWNATTGRLSINGVAEPDTPVANKIMLTLPDGGGVNTFDFTNYSPSPTCDLSAGSWMTISTAQLGALQGGHTAAGNLYNPVAVYGTNTCSPP